MKKNKLYQQVLTALLSGIIVLLSLIPNIGYILIPPGISLTIIHIPVLVGVFLVDKKNSLFLGFIFGLSSLINALVRATSPLDQAFIYPWISILPRMLFAFIAKLLIDFFVKLKDIKNGNIYIFITVSLITAFGLYFGLNSFINNFNNDTLTNVFKFITPIIILLFIMFYVYLIFFKYSNKAYIPAVMILSTFIHTILVLGFIALFSPKAFYDSFGTENTIIEIIFTIALVNGLLEAILGTIIASPITIAALIKTEGEENENSFN